MFFRGFVETKNKKCIEKFKGRTDFKTFEQVQSLPEYAGILAAETILIDVDDFEASEILFKVVKEYALTCRVYRTSRGKHFLFKNSGVPTNKTGCKLAIGLTADIKIGTRNSYEVLKYDNQNREILYDTAENEEAQQLPRWLFPVKSKMEFLNMETGDGRNQGLFNYILTLQSNDFSVEEARETIRIINKFVLKVPLSDDEIETVLRDDAFKKPVFFMGSTFLFDKFATFLKNNNHIIKINNQLHIYKNGIYISGLAEIEAEMIQHIPGLNRAKRTEVLAYLDILIRENFKAEDANLIAFENGLYNIVDDSFVEFTPEHIITNKIRWKYNPEAYSELADKTLNKIACNDPQIRALLEEAIGYCFYRRNELGKAFILTGDKSNGKSTFLSMVQYLLGDENISSLDLKELGDRFKTAEMFGKLANIGDDIGDEFIANPAIFKKLVTGERVSAERKGQNPFEFNNYSKLLFSANNIPRIKDKTGAVQRRLTIIPFDARFSADDPDFNPYIKHLLKTDEVMEYLINLGIAGLKRVLLNRKFTGSTKVQKAMDEYEENNNPIIGFFRECEDEEFQIENEPTNVVYKRYQEYCLANSLQPMSNIEFSKQVNRILNMRVENKWLNGKKHRIFIKNE
ncbi:DNA primase family protein [Hominenteromicrobium mulieris]|uniref:DNA primase family protein n=1 Tax=Hominenteromicrobium mulieris TaxID=2885357 RepID=UPI0020611651|nr:MAG: virulence-associated protein E [Bacteriophage sp.]DAU03867.1 MAG TPA: dsDNA helicase [Caudoviricetes sp.]